MRKRWWRRRPFTGRREKLFTTGLLDASSPGLLAFVFWSTFHFEILMLNRFIIYYQNFQGFAHLPIPRGATNPATVLLCKLSRTGQFDTNWNSWKFKTVVPVEFLKMVESAGKFRASAAASERR